MYIMKKNHFIFFKWALDDIKGKNKEEDHVQLNVQYQPICIQNQLKKKSLMLADNRYGTYL